MPHHSGGQISPGACDQPATQRQGTWTMGPGGGNSEVLCVD
jgi:hypothetical protein